MTLHYFSFPTNIAFGPGAVKELGPFLKDQSWVSPLVVTDSQVAQLGFFKKILKDLKRRGLRPVVFHEISPNPVKSDVLKGGEAFTEGSCDSIVALGGGAAMDVARAMALRIHHHRDLFDYDDLIGGSIYITEAIPPFVTIPTTAGTGSEVGRSAVISEEKKKKKRILFHPRLRARQVFADPELTYQLPPFVTAATGMDALTHHMEAFLAKGFHPMADGIALEGIKLISEALVKAVNQPERESRSKMMIAALMGAVAFQKGLGVVHSMAHPLSTLFNTHHGLANSLCLAHGMNFNLPGLEDRFKRMALAMGLSKPSGEAVISELMELNGKIGLPCGLSSQGIQEGDLEKLAQLAQEDFCHPNNPKEVRLEDFRQLYHHAL